MEPRIQYAKTSDGVNIAFRTHGSGHAYVSMPLIPWSHLKLFHEVPAFVRIYSTAGAIGHRLVIYDNRGSGLSDRDAPDYSLQGHLLDLEAVVDQLGLDEFALASYIHSGPVAIAYAARHPGRISKLVLSGTYARGIDYVGQPRFKALLQLLESDLELFSESAARTAMGWADEEGARPLAKVLSECSTREVVKQIYAEIEKVDVSDLLAQVRAPTLVIHQHRLSYVPIEWARSLAAGIPGAEMVMADEWEAAEDAVIEFFGRASPASAAPSTAAVHTILFTDVEGSTALTDRLGDTKARDLLREHERMVREALKAHGGSEVKALGDGFMASFSSATRALECAIAIQRALAERNESAEEPILVRVGLNAGEPIAEDEDLFGASVNRAARIAAMAQGGEILAANVVRELAEGKGFLFGDRGETALRGFDDPVRLFEVRWRDG